MFEIISQIGQTPPSTAFMLGFSMALALRRGRISEISGGLFKSPTNAGNDENGDSVDSTNSTNSTSGINSAKGWEEKQVEQ